MHYPVYQPYAIYLHVATNASFILLGAFGVAGSFNKGPFKSSAVTPRWAKTQTLRWVMGVAGTLCVILNLIALYLDLVP